MTSVADRLPQGWRWVLPGDLASRQTHSLGIGPFGSDLKVSDYTESGVPLVFVRNIRSGSFALANQPHVSKEKAEALFAHRVLPGDLLITKMGEPPGDAFVYPANACEARMTADCIRLRVAREVATPTFLMYATRASVVRQQIISATKGVAQKKISLDRYRNVRYPLPPLAEQHRIVAILDTQATRMDAAVALLERAKANLQRARASVLKAAVEGRLVPTETALARAEGRDSEPASALLARILTERRARWVERGGTGRYDEPVKPVVTSRPLPDGWTWATVEQLASDEPRSIQSGPFGSSLLHSEFQATGKLVIGIDNVQDGYFSPGAQNRISEAKYKQLAKYAARPRDLVITVMATIGRCCVIPANVESAIITKHVYRVTLEHRLCVPEYVMAVIRSPWGRENMLMESKGQTRPGLNGTIIKAFPVPVPPLAEQHRILAEVDRRLSVLDALETTLDANLDRSVKLRHSILKRAFEGKLVLPKASGPGVP